MSEVVPPLPITVHLQQAKYVHESNTHISCLKTTQILFVPDLKMCVRIDRNVEIA